MNEKIYKWLVELTNKKPKTFNEYFYYDIGEYLNLEIEHEFYKILNIENKTIIIKLKYCRTKKDVHNWLDEIANYINKRLEIENIIDDYLSN